MSGFDRLVVLFQGWSIWGVAKAGMIVALLLYTVFAVVVIRQVQLMSRTLNGMMELPLRLWAYGHLAVTLVVLVLAVLIL